MMHAKGTHAKAACDRCGCIFKYGTLMPEYHNGRRTGLLTCNDCWDGEHPQDRPRKHRGDAQALAHARPRQEKAADNDSPPENNAFVPNGQDYEAWLRSRMD
jgi:hypothetical protein